MILDSGLLFVSVYGKAQRRASVLLFPPWRCKTFAPASTPTVSPHGHGNCSRPIHHNWPTKCENRI